MPRRNAAALRYEQDAASDRGDYDRLSGMDRAARSRTAECIWMIRDHRIDTQVIEIVMDLGADVLEGANR